ncbi:Metal-binding regulatory protein cuf1 [Neolecta irregularis DAH-3]|uniref:Metal-binding regulatory protein cuf1 n=1 Tax=Neolecta irregularis (strain DAH-3) TaxID=1198029 RepID=A0A1U7LVW0_NEOID|nr:Metal-binding regulatory protein cuf1 [Neolecta irregularis DAH-3]|eukprot:OLL26759.1 Metal-binding regulatory protein cuf1 [Neolecta irregularis DAH-3]
MAFIRDGQKWACAQCIRGHRASQCSHDDRDLQLVQPKGRPPTQCAHCRGHRKANIHSRCDCGDRAKALGIKDDRSLVANSSAAIRPRRGSKCSLKLELGSCACFTGTACLCGPAKIQSVPPFDSKSRRDASTIADDDLSSVSTPCSLRDRAPIVNAASTDSALTGCISIPCTDSNLDSNLDSNPIIEPWIADPVAMHYPSFSYQQPTPSCSAQLFTYPTHPDNIPATHCLFELPTGEQLLQQTTQIYTPQNPRNPDISQQLEFFYRSGCANPGVVCLCGEGCACVGCATHPGNDATRNAIAHLPRHTIEEFPIDPFEKFPVESFEEFPELLGLGCIGHE